jgi:hypothetical protein
MYMAASLGMSAETGDRVPEARGLDQFDTVTAPMLRHVTVALTGI